MSTTPAWNYSRGNSSHRQQPQQQQYSRLSSNTNNNMATGGVNNSRRSCSTRTATSTTSTQQQRYDILRAALVTNRRHDLTNLHYDMQQTRRLYLEDAKRRERLEKKADAQHIDLHYFKPRVNVAPRGGCAEYSFNGKVVTVFEHLYRDGLHDIDRKVQLQSKQSFHENAKMWHGISEEPRGGGDRSNNSAIRGRPKRPEWNSNLGSKKRAQSANPSPWKRREAELQREEEQQKERARAKPLSQDAMSRLMAPTAASQSKQQQQRSASAPARRSSPSPSAQRQRDNRQQQQQQQPRQQKEQSQQQQEEQPQQQQEEQG